MKHHLLIMTLAASPALAHDPQITSARFDNGTVHVTVLHEDTGWDHYADGWAVLAPDGTELGYRTLYHPHVNEQPFTRSLSGITVPDSADHLLIRARCNVTGEATATYRIELPQAQ